MPEFRGRPPQRNIQGTTYNFLNFRVPVTPTKSGDLTLGPATWSLNLVTRTDIFGNPISTTPANPSSDTLQFHVLPIPTNNVPAGFNGAVGQFSLAQFDAGPATVAVGDPITLKIRITGKGSFDSLSLSAEQLGWRDFKTYPPSRKFESTDPLQIEGSKYFEQVISPENVGVKEIPAFAFSYFDPERRVLSHPDPSGHSAACAPHRRHAATHRRRRRHRLAPKTRPPRARLSTSRCAPASWRWPGRPCASGPVFSPARPSRPWPGFAPCSGGVKKTIWPTTRACAAAAKWPAACNKAWPNSPPTPRPMMPKPFTPPCFACSRSNWANASISPPRPSPRPSWKRPAPGV